MSAHSLTIVPHIHWHEGMMLTPQHFQQMELRHHQHLSHQLNLLSPYHWGIQTLEVDPIALNDGMIRILDLEAVMPDGLIINYRSDMMHVAALELDIRSFKPDNSNEEITIFLSMPMRTSDRSPTTGDFPRFVSIEGTPIKDENIPDNIVDIPRLFPRLILSIDNKPPALCIGLPILKIGFNESYTRVGFIPPCFYIKQDMHLWKQCADLAQRIREKAFYLSARWQNQMGTPMMAETESLLRPLMTVLPGLESTLNTNQIFPYKLFQQMCDVVGHLTVLRLSQLPPVLHGYNHNDIMGSFEPLLELINQYLHTIEESYAVLAFQQRERLFYLKLHKNNTKGRFLLGLRVAKGVTPAQMEEWLMDAVICSDFAIETVRNNRITGAKRKIIQGDSLADFMPNRGMVLVEVAVDPEYISSDQNINIFNPSDIAERRPTEIVCYMPKIDSVEKDHY